MSETTSYSPPSGGLNRYKVQGVMRIIITLILLYQASSCTWWLKYDPLVKYDGEIQTINLKGDYNPGRIPAEVYKITKEPEAYEITGLNYMVNTYAIPKEGSTWSTFISHGACQAVPRDRTIIFFAKDPPTYVRGMRDVELYQGDYSTVVGWPSILIAWNTLMKKPDGTVTLYSQALERENGLVCF